MNHEELFQNQRDSGVNFNASGSKIPALKQMATEIKK